MPPSAMIGMPAAADPFDRELDGGNLRHADTGDDARRADRARADADLDGVRAVVGQCLRAVGGRHVAADHLHAGVALLDGGHAIEHALRMAVRRVDDDHVDAGGHQRLHALVGVAGGAHGRARAQAAQVVLARQRMLDALQDVLDGDEAAQLHPVVDDEHALDAMRVHQPLGVLEFGALGDDDQAVALGHDAGHRLVEVRLEAQVAVGDDADDVLAVDDGKPRDAVLPGQREHFPHRHRRGNRDRILYHAAFEALDLGHLGRLLGGRHVLVNDAKAAFLRDRDREPRIGDRVHRRGNQRDVEVDGAGETGL